jgi:hypothetical protein
LLFSVPQNVVHILANPLMPIASVRLSHMIETASSTFLFGLIVVWLLHREHHSFADLVGTSKDRRSCTRQLGRGHREFTHMPPNISFQPTPHCAWHRDQQAKVRANSGAIFIKCTSIRMNSAFLN